MNQAPPGTRVRWLVVSALFSMSLLTIIDRVCISAAKSDMARDLALSDVAFGGVFSAFALGYALFQIPGGALVDRFGPRLFLAVIVALWSLSTAATGMAAALVPLIVIRFLFGAFEAGAYPAAARVVYRWLPAGETGLAQGFLFSGSRLGAALGLSLMAWSVDRLGWRSSFLLLGAIGLAWAACWALLFSNDPSEAKSVSPTELEWIRSGRKHPGAAAGAWRDLLRTPLTPALLFQYFASNFTVFICFTWFLPYLKDRYHLSNIEAGWYASLPLISGALANWVSGFVVDRLFRRGWRVKSRAWPAAAGFALAALALVFAPGMPSAAASAAVFALATFGVDMTLSPSWALSIDVGRNNTGLLSGAMNTVGNLGSFVSSLLFPILLKTQFGSRSYFWSAALLNLLGMTVWIRIGRGPSAGERVPS